MTKPTLSRRLLAGAAGLAVGLGGAIAAAVPAQAVIPDPVSKVFITDTCEGVHIKIKGNGTNRGWRIVAKGEVLHGSEHPSSLWVGGSQPNTFSTSIPAADAVGVKVEWWRGSTDQWVTDVIDTEYPKGGPEPHDWSPPPGAWPDCGDSPQVEVFKDCDGNVTVTVHAGNTSRKWRVDEDSSTKTFIGVGESHTFDAKSFDTVVEWKHHTGWTEADWEGEYGYVDRVKEDDCEDPGDDNGEEEAEEDNGGAGELPKTGGQTALVAGAALLLLTLGGAMFVMARRRRVTFTA